MILGTTQAFGNSAVSNSSSFSDIFNGADEETIYNELISGDDSDVQTVFDNQLALGDGGGGSGLPDIVLNGQDYQNMLALGDGGGGGLPDIAMAGVTAADDATSPAPGGVVNAPDFDCISFSAAEQIGSGSLALVTPQPSAAWMLLLLAPAIFPRRRSLACTCAAP